MSETRKIAAILVSDVVGYSRLAGADEDRTLSRLRGLRSDLIDPAIAAHHGRVVKRTGDGALVEFRSVVDAVRCAIEVQNGMVERNAGLPQERRINFRIGIHLGDVVEESDGDLMGDGVNIAARLEGIAEPGAICLSEQAYWQVKGRLDLAVTDLGATRLKNIAEPVRAYSLQVGMPALAKPAPEAKPPEPKRRSILLPLVAGIVALIALASGAGYFLAENRAAPVIAATPPPAEAAHLSIVVLPFANLSNDPAQDYFADGVTENLTTELSRIRGSFVIARNTAATYKGKAIDAKQIGKELGVRYLLEGSVQRDGTRVRVNAQLIDAQSGAHLWADRFEEDVADLFKLQDQVVARLANSLGIELVKAEAHAGTHGGNPDAIDLHMRGWALLNVAKIPKDRNDAARALFDAALALDPNDPDALAGEAYTYMLDYSYGWTVPGVDYDAKALGSADRALTLAADTMRAYDAKSYYLAMSKHPDEAVSVADAGLAINPNYARLYAARANAELFLGRFEQAKSDAQQAVRLSPRDPEMGYWHTLLCWAENGLAHFDAAVDECHKSIEAGWRTFYSYRSLAEAEFNSGHVDAALDAVHKMIEAGDHSVTPYLYLATDYALEGKLDEARTALAEALRLNPKLTVKGLTGGCPSKEFGCLKYAEGLRKAGLPEE